jgi:MoxR-like ATPase
MNDRELLVDMGEKIARIKTELSKQIIGQTSVIDDLLACCLSGGHCLLIGVPGLAKTTLIRCLSQCLTLSFNRIQFTPDLMPSDITGSEILFEDRGTGTREFKFVKGPVFSNIVLADEINRTPPKTQAALLQAMQEHEVTSSGTTFSLPAPFWVLATQNPIEQEGTYPLPEAQQDRFLFSVEIDYPSLEEEKSIAQVTTSSRPQAIANVLDGAQVSTFCDLVRRVPVADSVIDYAVKLARATRPADVSCPASVKEFITWGAGPRASQSLVLAAKAYAALDARPTPDINDVKRAAFNVLRHRIVLSFHAETQGISANEIIRRLLEQAGK